MKQKKTQKIQKILTIVEVDMPWANTDWLHLVHFILIAEKKLNIMRRQRKV